MNGDFLKKSYHLEGKSVLITGAAGQIGRELCRAYLECGVRVFATDVDMNRMKERLGKLNNDTSPDMVFFEMDVSKKKSVIKTFGNIFSTYGPIEILINNAGASCFEPFEERPEESFDWVMDVNLKGTFFGIQSYVNFFDKYKMKKGVIVNIASLYGIISPDFRIYTDCNRKNSEIYGATKAGIIQMTKYFGVHLADRNIRVNAVSPGGIYNPDNPQGEDFIRNYSLRCPMKRMANDKELLGAIIYLSSDAASYTTGQNIIVDGGMSCW